MDKEKESHPSFGVITISRTSGGDEKLFGSATRHQYKVCIRISTAELVRSDLHYDHHYAKERLVEIEMSQSQFAEFITSMGIGEGVPCTIRSCRDEEGNYKSTPPVSITPKREQFEQEFRDKIDKMTKDTSKLMSRTHEILDKKSILKADREELQGLVSNISSIMKDSIPFMTGMWNEQMDKTVNAAKGEVEAFTRQTLTNAGLQKVLETLGQSGENFIEIEGSPPEEE